jgi:hypothetical protein
MVQPMLQPINPQYWYSRYAKAGLRRSRSGRSSNRLELKWTLFNAYIFISPVGGTGGGCFRKMLSRFLTEAAAICGEPGLADSADEFRAIGERWEELGTWFRQTSEAAEPIPLLVEGSAALDRLANLEEAAWQRLRRCCEAR